MTGTKFKATSVLEVAVLVLLCTPQTLAESGWGRFWQEYKLGFNPIIRNDKGKIDKPFTIAAVSLMGLNAADWGTTRYGIAMGAHEAMPGMAVLVNHEPAGAIFKLGVIGPIFVLSARECSQMRGKKRILAYVVMGAEVGFYLWVVRHNVQVIRHLRLRSLVPEPQLGSRLLPSGLGSR